MNRGYNEERYRPLEDDGKNKPQTSKTAHPEPAPAERGEAPPDKTPHPPEIETKEEKKKEEGRAAE